MFMDRSDLIIRLDTISYILAALSMLPIIVLHRKSSIFIYTAINISILIIYMIILNKEQSIKPNIFIDFIMDNMISMIGIGIFAYSIFSINYKALQKAEIEISERKKAEEQRDRLQMQLVQSQKLESVGLLAGGVAHDFNNMLAAVQGFAELIRDDMGKNDDKSSEINEIIKASKKARDLTQQLLAFARVQPLDIKTIDINKSIREFLIMLARTVRENILIQEKLSDNQCTIEADKIQIEQVILNLTLNAQDAMPDGGEIFIETSKVTVDENIIRGYEAVEPGEFILLTVSDNGNGMDKETLEKIFDPFYTTKEFGKGTGLGLSTVYGIVKQHHGMIHVYSEKDNGSTFKIYFPFKNLSASDVPETAEKTINSSGNETILAVEDNPEVRNLVRLLLKKQGYNVLIAQDANTAIDISGKHNGTIDLLITDVVIPGMNGMLLYEKIRTTRPDIKILYMSGYTSSIIAPDGRLDKGINFIQKPFSIQDFTKKIRDVIDN
jgi:signal transduction histidine kinase/CheY-like chemotaxis protein